MPVPAAGQGNAADLGWRQMLVDPRLQRLVELALLNNRDLRVAALNVDAVRAQYQIQDSARYPAIGAVAGGTRQRAQDAAGGAARAAAVHGGRGHERLRDRPVRPLALAVRRRLCALSGHASRAGARRS